MSSDQKLPAKGRPPDELYRALGHVVFAFGQLDEALHDALWMALGKKDECRILTSGMRFPQLVERFRAIYSRFSNEGSGESGVDAICGELTQLNQERNRDIHALWGFWAETGKPVRTQRPLKRGALGLKMETVDPANLFALAQKMEGVTDKIFEIMLDFDRQNRSTRNLDASIIE